MRRGFSLIELVLALVVTGLLAALSLPAIGALHDRLRTDAAARALVAAHLRARFIALAEQRVVVLELTPARLAIRAVESPGDTVLRWEGGGPAVEGVLVTGMPHQAAFGPAGIGLGLANATFVLQRGGAARQVIVSRYGRVRLQ